MRAIDADVFYKDICDSLNEMTRIGIAVDGEWLWGKLNDSLANAPTIEPEPHWIPCSERLPDQYGNYLISIDGEEPDIGTINPNDPRGWSLCDANGFYWASDKALNITAWMPLPEPYREGE